MPQSRREALAGLAAGALVLGLPGVDAAETTRKLKVVVVGAHPDDPELSAGGTIARYTDLGHEVVCVYLTRGELGVMKDKLTPKQTGEVRSDECEKSCLILKAKPRFVGQIDASTEVNPTRYEEMRKVLESENPDVVFTHWPIDQHRDHRAASLLVYDAWLKSQRSFDLFYFEVKTGLYQSQFFKPTHYVDITPTVQRKQKACYIHSHGEQVYVNFTDLMHRFRGLESGCEFAEAFALQPRKAAQLPS